MDKAEIHKHWTSWAQEHGEAIEATTRAKSAKSIELSALNSSLTRYTDINSQPTRILEVGCGNGVNCVSIATHFPKAQITGIDFVSDMIEHAHGSARSAEVANRCHFLVGDAMKLDEIENLPNNFDVAFTVRCLINLQSDENQRLALEAISDRVSENGFIFLIENSQQTYSRQNQLRVNIGLEPRTPAPFNHFIDEESLTKFAAECGLTLVNVVDISSLHDTVLYALLPSVSNGEIIYDHPIVLAATQMEMTFHEHLNSPFGDFGQNRLFIFQKES